MAAVLKPLPCNVSAEHQIYVADAQSVELLQRRKLLRDPSVWAMEFVRLLFYVLARVIAVPWLLIWPAVVFWVLWVSVGFDAAQVGLLLQDSIGPQIGWIYVIGASVHSLTAIGCRPYESEVERRLDAYMLHWQARRGWLMRNARQYQKAHES